MNPTNNEAILAVIAVILRSLFKLLRLSVGISFSYLSLIFIIVLSLCLQLVGENR